MAGIESSNFSKAVAEILGLSGAAPSAETTMRKNEMRIHLDSEVMKSLDGNKKEKKGSETLEKSLRSALNAPGDAERLAFEYDPTLANKYNSVYKAKTRLIPDKLLKRIAIQDDLVAAIVQARQNQISAFGRPRPDRFSTGFVIEPRQDVLERIEKNANPEEKKQLKDSLQQRIAAVSKKMMTCGSDNLDLGGNQDDLTFPQYLSMSVRNAVVLGRLATEVLWKRTTAGRIFNGFRVIDAGTIYKAEPQKSALESVRRQAKVLLAQMKNERLDPEKFERDEYKWVQVFDERPVQAFADDECLVHNFYPVADVELDGYPVTPLDTVMSAVTTHINITTHNKLYFQSGRAARGMLVIKSDDADESIVARMRQQFNAQINSVSNAWRMPVFACGAEDNITWQSIDSGGRDMEFQYLADMNARVILSAFGMSPEELPGWGYLSRGTNNQAMSEGNNEYKLEAARDVGIRPLLAQVEDFLNQCILPLFGDNIAKDCVIKLVGLDSETAEKESVRLQQDMPVHMTYDEVLEKVEKKAVGKRMGGEFPINPQYQAILDKYLPVGQILEFFFGVEGASKDPQWAYVRDPFWFQMQQMVQQQQAAAQQAAAQQQQQGAGGPQDGGGGDDGGGGGQGGGGESQPTGEAAKPTQGTNQTENQKDAAVAEASASPAGDLSTGADQALGALSKAEKQLPPKARKLVTQQKMLVEDFLAGWKSDMHDLTKDVLGVADALKPKTKA
jgi:hypothetical protein